MFLKNAELTTRKREETDNLLLLPYEILSDQRLEGERETIFAAGMKWNVFVDAIIFWKMYVQIFFWMQYLQLFEGFWIET